jgi:hypothetical protein
MQQKLVVYLAKAKAPAKKGTEPAAGDLSQQRPRVVAIVIAQEMPKQ